MSWFCNKSNLYKLPLKLLAEATVCLGPRLCKNVNKLHVK